MSLGGWEQWLVAVAAIACVQYLIYLGQRVRKLEEENKKQADKITWLHDRCTKLERTAPAFESFVRGAGPRWQYDVVRDLVAHGKLMEQTREMVREVDRARSIAQTGSTHSPSQ